MIPDGKLYFSDNVAITVTAVSTAIWLGPLASGNTGRNIALAEPLYMWLTVPEAFLAAGAATLTIDIITDDVEALSSPSILWSSGAIPKASLTLGMEPMCIPLPMGGLPGGAYLEYLGLSYTVATGPFTAGKVYSGLARVVPRIVAYKPGHTIAS